MGQVRLFTLYVLNRYCHCCFTEKTDFLNWLGVFDDPEPQQSHALMANYMMDQPNRSEVSGLYAIYFGNEGENLLEFSHAVLIHK